MIFDLLSDVAHTLWSETTPTLADRLTNLLVLFTAFRRQIMPQVNLTVNEFSGIIAFVHSSPLKIDSLPSSDTSQIIAGSSLTLSLPQPPRKFYRHGWQSWTLTTWLDPSEPPLPIRAPEFRAKDEDPAYAYHKNHVSAWVCAVEVNDDDILLLGALRLSGRVELSGSTLNGFYEDNLEGDWLIARGKEDQVFEQYAERLESKFGKTRFSTPPRVWCSWYSLYKWIDESNLAKVLHGLGDLPFDVFQIDDGWQIAHGDWEANHNFPSGLKSFADRVKSTGRKAGIWLAPFMVTPGSQLAKDHPNWILRDEQEKPVPAGITWGGKPLALDSSHPEVLDWLEALIRKVVGWGYDYLKLDFLYQGALIGKRHQSIAREEAYRNALRVMREAAGNAYILACGAPVIPSLGLCDGVRIGPDVTNFWINQALTTWLNNPNETSTANAIRTSVHRLWLKPLINIDPDVMYFRARFNALTEHENQLLQGLGKITDFKATSDLPVWWNTPEREMVRRFLVASPTVRKKKRYEFVVDGRDVDFSPAIPLQTSNARIPVWLARIIGVSKVIWHQVLPAFWASRQK